MRICVFAVTINWKTLLYWLIVYEWLPKDWSISILLYNDCLYEYLSIIIKYLHQGNGRNLQNKAFSVSLFWKLNLLFNLLITHSINFKYILFVDQYMRFSRTPADKVFHNGAKKLYSTDILGIISFPSTNRYTFARNRIKKYQYVYKIAEK